MKAAVLGSNELGRKICDALLEWGGEVVSFCPEQTRFYVKKRALAQAEEISGHSRFYDLFRIVHERQYGQEVLRTQAGGAGWSEGDREHFLAPHEVFVDVDIVVDVMGLRTSPHRAPILGENSSPVREMVWVGQWPQPIPDMGVMAYVLRPPACPTSLGLLEQLAQWAREGQRQLLVVARSFEFLQSLGQWQRLVKRVEEDGAKSEQCFLAQEATWQALEDYQRAKHPRPSPPQGKIQFFEGYWPLGIDYLSDRKRGFLALERPEFRGGEDIVVRGIDQVVFGPGLVTENDPAYCLFELQTRETGYFKLDPERHSDQKEKLLLAIEQLFSRT